MGINDGNVIGMTKIVDHGRPEDRYNLVIVSDGYQAGEMNQFSQDALDFVTALFGTPPFDGLRCAFNVFRIDVSSTDSGADDPVACGGTGATPKTYFDASFCNGNIRRLLTVNNQTVRDVVDAQVPQWHQILVIVNSATYGGAGGTIAVTSTSGAWTNIALHEFGHSGFGLADEYEYWAGCGADAAGTRDNHPNNEPAQPNVTVDSNRNTIKWRHLIDPATAMPTTDNADCSNCDPQVNPVAANTVGAFEGAHYYHCDAYRPQFDCMMRNFNPFCAVCRETIRNTLRPFLADCYAPVFQRTPWFICIFQNLAYLSALAILVFLIWIPGIYCIVKQLIFRIRNCSKGNSDPCIVL